MLELTPIFILLIIFGFVYAIISINVRHKERRMLMEKGADPSTIFQPVKSEKFTSLKYGLFLIGIAIGLFFGSIFEKEMGMPEEVAYFSMVFLFGGLALVISYFLGKKLD
jgi:fucose permease